MHGVLLPVFWGIAKSINFLIIWYYVRNLICLNLNFEDPLICLPDGSPSTVQDVFLSRLMKTGATECASTYNFANQMEEHHREFSTEKAKSILKNIVTAVNNLWVLMDGLHTALLKKLPGDGKI